MIIKTDCKLYKNDRPCVYNKSEKIMCDDCAHYQQVDFKILIIKLDAVGDVLRTTSILPSIKRKYPNAYITWLTKLNCKELFENIELVDELLFFESPELLPTIQTTRYNVVYNPDTSVKSCALTSFANADVRYGYCMNELGKSVNIDDAGIKWLEMGAFDQLKKANTETYQSIIHNLLHLDYKKDKIIIRLSDNEKKFAENFTKTHNLKKYKKIVGLNTGASSRWKLKQWQLSKFVELIKLFENNSDIGILLYGGPEEAEKNMRLEQMFSNVINTGSNNAIREFFALLSLSDVILTGDTMALHASAALNKPTICLFGPTSSNEIEDYGVITKVIPEMECLVCYKNECDFVPNCMQLIEPKQVYDLLISKLRA